MSFESFVAAAIQIVSGSDVSENLAAAAELIEEATLQDARLIVLPENFAIMGRDETDKLKVRGTNLVRSTPKELKPLAGGRAQRKPPVPMSQVKCIPAGCQHPTSILVSLVNPALIPPGYGSMGILSGGGATLTTG